LYAARFMSCPTRERASRPTKFGLTAHSVRAELAAPRGARSRAADKQVGYCVLVRSHFLPHGIRNVQLAGSPAVASRPAEAVLCLESGVDTRTRVWHRNTPIEVALPTWAGISTFGDHAGGRVPKPDGTSVP
jgi:hypothetical protein